MTATKTVLADLSLDFTLETRVHASLDDCFDALLEELGPSNVGQAQAPAPQPQEDTRSPMQRLLDKFR